ncbi:MAG: YihY/virulence factor BrkB family protein [Gallionellaceae bacterium]|nr:YihY/virulence factor BrkB family protein [Gallionellaceae bacterium]
MLSARGQCLKRILLESVAAWTLHRASSRGAALAFYALFSMTPILLVAIAVAGYFFGAEAAQGEIIAQIQGLVGENGAQAIQALLAAARNPASGVMATVVAGVLLLIGTTTVFVELKESLDDMWGNSKKGKSALLDLLRKRLLSFSLVCVLALLLLISLVISAALAVLERYAAGIGGGPTQLLSVLASLMSFLVIACLFAVIYKMLPDTPLSWRDVWIGAIFTAALFSLGKYLIGLYLGNSGVVSSFGAVGSLVALLLWIYYSAQIFYLGAEFTRQYALNFGSLCTTAVLASRLPAHCALLRH